MIDYIQLNLKNKTDIQKYQLNFFFINQINQNILIFFVTNNLKKKSRGIYLRIPSLQGYSIF